MKILNCVIVVGIILLLPVVAWGHCGTCGVGDEKPHKVVCEKGKDGKCVHDETGHGAEHNGTSTSKSTKGVSSHHGGQHQKKTTPDSTHKKH